MCLLVLAWNAHPRYRLIVAANRDEYHDRPAGPLTCWPPPEDMLAGRDLRAGGTWLGVDRRRRFGVITNYRDLQDTPATAPSRGGLIPRYLREAGGPGEYLTTLEREAGAYGGFNLLLSDGDSLWYGSNRVTPFARALAPGVHGLSNEHLDAPWPKLLRVRAGFEAWLRENTQGQAVSPEALFALLDDRRPALPPGTATGRADTAGPGSRERMSASDWERTLSAPFVQHPQYGTRCSTVVLMEASGSLRVAERRFDREGRRAGETEYRLCGGEWIA